MNDIEMRRSILQHAYDHRLDHQLPLVGIEDMPFLKEETDNRIFQNIKFLKDQRLLKTEDSAWTLISITTPGIGLVESPEEFNKRFPIRHDVPLHTRQLIDTVEEMLTPNHISVLNQFKKAKIFLYDQQPPDYLNSVKESVSAVEGIARVACNEPKKTLSDLIPKLRQEHLSHPAMGKILEAIYAVRSDEPGAAHAAHKTSSFKHTDAEFILNVSSAVIIYLMRQST